MTTSGLFSVSNELPTDATGASHLELNPTVFDTERGPCYGLSVILLGASTADPDATELPSLRLGFADDHIDLDPLHGRTERTDSGHSLTVALFETSRTLLERLTRELAVDVRLGTRSVTLRSDLSEYNRRNIAGFLAFDDRRNRARSRLVGAVA